MNVPTPEQFARVDTLFHRLVDLPADERASKLATIRENEPVVHDELARLLTEPTGADVDGQAIDDLAAAARDLVSPEGGDGPRNADPERIGPYRVVRRIGEGGMGRVYEAEQEEGVRRRLAVKLLRPGLGSASVIARFHQERQALAVMDHPAIARVFDAGTTEDGRPFFAMELVEGEPITDFADRRNLSIGERVELFLPICDAVQHAHAKGLIHRDLKPSNILVAERETEPGEPAPKVIDFGIAKATEKPLVERTLATRLGELVGTPEYMSPEQATLGAVDVDTRSDVYALGLVLYELLTGELPLPVGEMRRLAFDELCRRIREDETPRPSTRTRDPSRARTISGDLDLIVLEALAKDRERRYASAAALAADLRRFLRDEPVQAVPPRWSYRARKFVRRHFIAVVATAAVIAALVAGLATALVGLGEARESEREARTALVTAERTSQLLVGFFQGSDPRENPGLDLTARELLARGAERVEALEGEPQVQARLLESLGEVYRGLGAYDEAEPLLLRSVELRESGSAPDAERLAGTLSSLGGLYRARADLVQAEATYRRALETLDEAAASGALSPGEIEDETAGLLNNLGIVLRQAGRLDEAAEVYERSLAIVQDLEEEPSSAIGSTLYNIGAVHYSLGHHRESLEAYDRALENFRALLPENHPHFATIHNNLSLSHRALGDLSAALLHAEGAVTIDRETLPDDHPGLGVSIHSLGTVLWRLGRWDEAEAAFEESRSIYAAAFGDRAFRALAPRASLGLVALARGDAAKAVEILGEVVADREALDHPETRSRLVWRRQYASALRRNGELEAAREVASNTREIADATDEPVEAARACLQLAILAVTTGDLEAAERWFTDAESRATRLHGSRLDRSPLDDAGSFVTRSIYWTRRGEIDRAFDALGAAINHPGRSAWLATTPAHRPLHDDPRWPRALDRLEERLGTEDYSSAITTAE